MVSLLADQFDLSYEDQLLLQKTMRQLKRNERRRFFSSIKPKEREIKLFLKEQYAGLDEQERERWTEITVRSLLARGGEPDLCDSMVMDVLGRISVYKRLRETAEREGIRLNALTNFGGIGMVIMLAGAFTALILYLINR